MSTNYTYQQLYNLIKEAGVHPALGDYGAGWSIEQNSHELAVFLHAMQTLGVRSCLELGTGAYGGLARFMIERLQWQVWSVDKNAPYYYPGAGVFTQLTTEEARKYFHTDQFDLVFIDADHAFMSVDKDYNAYKDVARLAIGFHDIAGLRDCEGSKQWWGTFWREFKGAYEVIENSSQAAGIGWIVKAELDSVSTLTVDSFSATPKMLDAIEDYEQARQLKPKRGRKPKNA